MMGGEEGKLLAGAAGFYSPWGSERKNRPRCICAATSFHEAEKKHFALSAGTCHPPHSHQGEREKNEYS